MSHLRAKHLWIFIVVWGGTALLFTLMCGGIEQNDIGFEVPLVSVFANLSPMETTIEEVAKQPPAERRWVRFPANIRVGESCAITENYTSGKHNTRYHRVYEALYLRGAGPAESVPGAETASPLLITRELRNSGLSGHVPFEQMLRISVPDPAAQSLQMPFEGMLVEDAGWVGRVPHSRDAPTWILVVNGRPKFVAAIVGWIGIIGLLAAFWALWWYRAGRVVREVRFQIDRPECRLGDTLRVDLMLRMAGAHEITSATVTLTCTEHTVKGGGKQAHRMAEVVHTRKQEFWKRERLDPKRPGEWKHEFTIPPDAMHTFSGSPHRVEWKLAYHIDIPGLLDLAEEREIRVKPERVRPNV